MLQSQVQVLIRSVFVSAVITLSALPAAFGWGKQGHSIVAQNAALLLSSEPKGEFLKSRAFDLGYYANVPDIVWKKPATYDIEANNHFMDFEIFNRELKESKIEKPFEMDRLAFNAAFPKIPESAGRAWWRVRELQDRLNQIQQTLMASDMKREDRHKAQLDWLVTAGALGHYIGDLSQPLHVTENYDGQLTDQKGVHAFYEDKMVDDLIPGLQAEALKLAQTKWKRFHKEKSEEPVIALLKSLTAETHKDLATVLKTDKKIGRKDEKKAVAAYHQMIVRNMATGSLYLAEIWRRDLGWDYDGNKFFAFDGMPAYIYPPTAKDAGVKAASAISGGPSANDSSTPVASPIPSATPKAK